MMVGSSANNLVRAVRFKYNMLRVLPSKDFAKLYKLEHLWQGFSVQAPKDAKIEITDDVQEQETSFYMNSDKKSNAKISALTYKEYMKDRFGGDNGIWTNNENAGVRQIQWAGTFDINRIQRSTSSPRFGG